MRCSADGRCETQMFSGLPLHVCFFHFPRKPYDSNPCVQYPSSSEKRGTASCAIPKQFQTTSKQRVGVQCRKLTSSDKAFARAPVQACRPYHCCRCGPVRGFPGLRRLPGTSGTLRFGAMPAPATGTPVEETTRTPHPQQMSPIQKYNSGVSTDGGGGLLRQLTLEHSHTQ